MTEIKVMLDPGAHLPERAHVDDAGYDLRAIKSGWAHPGYTTFETGVHVQIPSGYVGLLTSKSGLMSKGLTSRGTIDAGFVGAIKVVLYNQGNEGYLVKAGEKISQLVLIPIITPELTIVDKLDETDRGNNGFGSTGRV